MDRFRHGEHDMEMWTIWKTPTHVIRPFDLPRPQTLRAMPIAAGTGEPLLMVAIDAGRLIVTKATISTLCHQVQCGIL
ncbi:MAG: hypothetical protein R3F19_32805 [Verrucomicrobiales bacterium]